MRRQRGMTLIEIMIAMLLAGIVSAFILMITRSQLIAYEQNDQVARMQQNERAGQLVNAVRWYERAAQIDPNSAAAQDKLAAIADRRTKEGMAALSRADVFRKRNNTAKALEAYQQAADLLPSTNDKRAEAQQWVEKLKQ